MIILLDIDGVLIENHAYRAALKQTVTYFSRRLGLGDLAPTDSDIDVYEAQSITVEWDSVAISVAALVLERLVAAPIAYRVSDEPRRPEQALWSVLEATGAQPTVITRPDFSALARRVGEATPQGGLPARTALELFLADLHGRWPQVGAQPAKSRRRQRRQPEADPGQERLVASLLDELLANSYDIDRAPAMQLHQNFVLGHLQYTEYYGLPARLECEPLLEALDRPALNASTRDQLLARRAAGDAFPVVYTARPSLAPVEVGPRHRGYTPEAEIARQMVGLEAAPVIGYGKVDWIARRVGRSGSELVKPSPVQPMAAIGAARTGLELESLKAALAVERGDHLRYPLAACAGETVHVLDDSTSSLRAASQAVELLNRQDLNLRLVRHGIAPAGSPKRETLARVADVVHNDVNEGLAQVLSV